ncbi:tautomerase family protein [Serratia ureilytica]
MSLEEDDLYGSHLSRSGIPRSANFVLIEAMLSSGSPDARKQLLLQSLVQELALIGLDSNDLMVLFIELDRLNSSFGGGRRASPLSMSQ